MPEFFRRLFSTDFMPDVYCLRDPAIVALHAISDGLIALAYFVIPAALILLVRRRRDLAFRWVYVLFGAFILACGATHVLNIITLWSPAYRLEGTLKAFTALVSMATAALLWRLVPVAVALPGPEEFRREIAERRRAEEEATRLNAELENRVAERTLQLESANAKLAEFAATLDKTQTIVQKLDGTILYWNSGAESTYGWPREEALGRKSHELLEAAFPLPLAEIQAELLKTGSWNGEFVQRRRDGSSIWVASTWALHRNLQGEPISVANVNNDITELKHANEALRASEATARSLFENASQGILTADRAGRIVDANAMAQGLFGYTRAELTGALVEMLLPESFRARHTGHRAAYAQNPHARPMGQGMDLVGRRKDGSEFPVEISLSFVAEHRSGGLAMAFVSDITARKQANQEREGLIAKLEAALSEKIVLLKEVHHRVKNNMAVIAGLLGMQANTFNDERLSSALAESQQRVASMALIHEYLYATGHLDRVNFGKYVQQLASEICMSYAMVSDRLAVAIEAEEIDLPVHRAIPCGLILNELLSNAFKHAFPDGRGGKINVRLARLEAGEISLSCEDDGVGVPESFDWRNSKSLGLKIIQILTRQIDGKLALDRSGGTRFELRFSSAGQKQNQSLPALASAVEAAEPAPELLSTIACLNPATALS
ncbi:MAG TPA: PAS domain S-box protein [Bryobacteraceae bacterium]|nr:PAS domain S-box protein [Bryobacteraceae bacterium]